MALTTSVACTEEASFLEKRVAIEHVVDGVLLDQRLRKTFPRCLFSDEDLDHRRWNSSFGRPSINIALRPALPRMFFLGLLSLASQIAMICFVKFNVTCSSTGMASYPNWIYVAMLPFAAVRVANEWFCVRFYYPEFGRRSIHGGLVPFKVAGESRFAVWLILYAAFSVANFYDMITDSSFTAVTLASMECEGNDIGNIWESAKEQSLMGKLSLPIPNLYWVTFGAWICSLFQLVLPLLALAGVSDSAENKWKPFCANQLYNEEVYGALAEASGLATIQGLAIEQRRAILADGFPPPLVAPALSRQMASRVVLSYVLENSFQLNLQASLFAINMYLSDHRLSSSLVQAGVSLFLGIATTLAKLREAYSFFSFMQEDAIVSWLQEKTPEVIATKRSMCLVRCGCIALIVSLIYALCKLVAVFSCEDSILNYTGCAAIEVSN